MKEHFEKKLLELRSVQLSHTDKIRMRNSLQHYMLTHPVKTSLFARAYHAVFARDYGVFVTPTISFHVSPVLSVAALVVCLTFGTAFVAEHSLPGDTLYAVKTRVTEPVQGALAVSDVAQVQWSSELFERRLLEAESLAETGRLSQSAQVTLQNGLEDAARRLDTHTERFSIATASRDLTRGVTVADAVQDSFAERVVVHESRLEALGASSSSTGESIKPILSIVKTQKDKHRRGGNAAMVLHSGQEIAAGTLALAAPTQKIIKKKSQQIKEVREVRAENRPSRGETESHESHTDRMASSMALETIDATSTATTTVSIATTTATTTPENTSADEDLQEGTSNHSSDTSSHNSGSSHND